MVNNNNDRRGRARNSKSLITDTERAERIRGLLDDLCELNRSVPVIVEGKKDATALKTLGLVGEIITYNQGRGVYDFCQGITDRHSRVVLLLDWDPEGEGLMRKLATELEGHWESFSHFRNTLKILCQKEIKDVEGVPRLLVRLECDDTLAR